jgi:magnesium-transporting ATPase (P-type)
LLFVIGAFGMFFWAEARGLSIEEARTLVVNTFVVMEIFYLFSVRYLYQTSFTWSGLFGTPAVLIGVSAIITAQLLFTYAPFMQLMFATRAISLLDGMTILGIGVGLFFVLEFEKFVRRRFNLWAD